MELKELVFLYLLNVYDMLQEIAGSLEGEHLGHRRVITLPGEEVKNLHYDLLHPLHSHLRCLPALKTLVEVEQCLSQRILQYLQLHPCLHLV